MSRRRRQTARPANRWLPARLSGAREPAFRPNRADPRKLAHVNFDPLRPKLLTETAAQLRSQRSAAALTGGHRAATCLAGLLLTALTLAVLLPASDAPFRNPAAPEAEFIFTFRANGDWLSGAALALPDPANDQRPVHMRTALPAQRTRAPVTVRLVVDGRPQKHVFRSKGFKSDGSSVGKLRVPLTWVHITSPSASPRESMPPPPERGPGRSKPGSAG